MQYQSEGASRKTTDSNTNMMLKPPTMATAPNSLATQDHLQPPVNLSSNSSSVKSIASTGKKHKVLSSGHQKKFHRHFKQLPLDEEVLNCMYLQLTILYNYKHFTTLFFNSKLSISFVDFSCAFVSDILLQGFLYITKRHIAFYSNVFGYITKLLIPITSVTKISKEKTVKIIPNAIAVATVDERHVFSSFLSREAAYQLMVAVWKEALPMCDIDVTASAAQLAISTVTCKNYTMHPVDGIPNPKISVDETHTPPKSNTLQVHQKRASNSGVSELEDESSSAISGNEALTKLLQSGHLICNQQISNDGSSSNSYPSKGDLSANRDSNPEQETQKTFIDDIKPSTPAPIGSTVETTDKLKFTTLNQTLTRSIFTFKIPRTIHIAYFALSLVIILALIAAFLFYRIAELKSSHFKPFSFDELYQVHIVYLNSYMQ